jgi:acetyltransferase-like isoleucine patch superfamily enzyme
MTSRDESACRPAVDRVLELARESEGLGRVDEARLLRAQMFGAEPGAPGSAADIEAPGSGTMVPRGPPMARRLGRRLLRPAVESLAQRPRIWKYRVLSSCRPSGGPLVILQPVLFVGPGEVVLGAGVQFGWKASPLFYTGYCHVEVSKESSRFEVGDRTEFNNNLMVKSEGAGIRIGQDGLFGAHVEIFDSDFHDLDPARRKTGVAKLAPVEIGDNVFVGMGVRILKGTKIGSDSVVGAGAVVTGSIPAGVIAAGNPARVIREL